MASDFLSHCNLTVHHLHTYCLLPTRPFQDIICIYIYIYICTLSYTGCSLSCICGPRCILLSCAVYKVYIYIVCCQPTLIFPSFAASETSTAANTSWQEYAHPSTSTHLYAYTRSPLDFASLCVRGRRRELVNLRASTRISFPFCHRPGCSLSLSGGRGGL